MLNFRIKIISGIILIVGLAILATLFFKVDFLNSKEKTINKDFANLAREIINECASSSHRPGCYDKEIPKLMDYISMQEAFEVTRIIQQEDQNYWFCHVLGHNLSARETAKDPSKWKDVVAKCPSGVCSNGCIHGAFQERFRTETLSNSQIDDLMPDLKDICEAKADWSPTGMEQASCYHALGHLMMYISGGNILKSNEICEKAAVKPDGRNFLRVCYDGNFMQIFQPLEPEDFALVRDIAPETAKDAFKFCSRFTGEKNNSCYRESWPLSREQILTADGLVKFCSYTSDPDAKRMCYNAMFYIIPVQVNFDLVRIGNLCRSLPQDRKGQCFADSASRFIETDYRLVDKSITLCQAAEEFGVQDECYKELLFYSTFNFHPGSQDFINLCNALPNLWKDKCLAGDR